jgi:membrane fusion protein (multidrug efflux system)
MKSILALVSAAILLISGCSDNSDKRKIAAPSTQQQKKKPGVKIVKIALQPLSVTIKTGGTIESNMQTTINAPAEGMIESLNANEGDLVSQGAVLGYVVSSDQQNMLALTRSDLEREKSAAGGDENAEPVNSARTKLEMAKGLYRPFPVVSPSNGVVISKSVEIGSSVNARQPMMVIADLRQLVVKTAVAERFVSSLRTGLKVRLHIPALGDSAIIGQISLVNPAVDAGSRTCGIEVSLPRHKLIKPGMTAVCDIVIASKPLAVAVPHDAVVVKPNGDKLVFTVRDSTAFANKITTGLETNALVEILSGINANDLVVVAGNESLNDGAEVKISQPKTGAQQKSGSNR